MENLPDEYKPGTTRHGVPQARCQLAAGGACFKGSGAARGGAGGGAQVRQEGRSAGQKTTPATRITLA